MQKKEDTVMIQGHSFSKRDFEKLLGEFKEALCHTSLSIEEAFRELESADLIIETSKDKAAFEYFSLLSSDEQAEIRAEMHKMIVFKGRSYGVFAEELTGDDKQFERLYKEHFKYFEPYLYYFAVFDENGDFDKISTFNNLNVLFINLPARMRAYDKAYNMKKDSLNAYDYVMRLSELKVPNVIEINNIINASDEDSVLGFKRTNNFVTGASFQTVDKAMVPFELQRLFSDYEAGMGYDIQDPNEKGISACERYRRVTEILRREAAFHIRFIRIHPFNDGNGRTGRTILNYNLLRQGVAPVLITEVMSDDYKECINNFDVDGLAKMMLASSAQQLSVWISNVRYNHLPKIKNMEVENEELAKIFGGEVAEDKSSISKIFKKIHLF